MFTLLKLELKAEGFLTLIRTNPMDRELLVD